MLLKKMPPYPVSIHVKVSELHYEPDFYFYQSMLINPNQRFIILCVHKFGGQILAFKIFSVNKIYGKGTFNCVKEQMTQLCFTVITTKWQKLTTSYKDGALKVKCYLPIHSPPTDPSFHLKAKGICCLFQCSLENHLGIIKVCNIL